MKKALKKASETEFSSEIFLARVVYILDNCDKREKFAEESEDNHGIVEHTRLHAVLIFPVKSPGQINEARLSRLSMSSSRPNRSSSLKYKKKGTKCR